MTGAACRQIATNAPIANGPYRPDRFAELLECMADLLVEARREREDMGAQQGNDPRVPEAMARLAGLERSLGQVGAEAASVHHLLQRAHLI